MGISRADVGIHVPDTDPGQRLGTRRATKRTAVVVRDGNESWYISARRERDHSVVRRVLNHVEGHVTEVALVGDAPTAAQAGLAVAEDVPGNAEARSEVVPVLLPEA